MSAHWQKSLLEIICKVFFTILIRNVFVEQCFTCLLPVVSWVRGHQKPKHDTMLESNSTSTLLSELKVLRLSIFLSRFFSTEL